MQKNTGRSTAASGESCTLVSDAQTVQIRAICATSNNASDAAVIPDLLDCLSKAERLDSLTGDGAYDTKQVHETVIGHGATSIIPPRENTLIRKGSAFEHRNAAMAACQRLGRRIWKAWSGHHRRSLVEAKMNCIKRLGERVIARNFESQVNELHIRAAIFSRFTELSRPETVA